MRLEDPDLLTGRRPFTADLPLPDGTLHAAFARSPLAHADVLHVGVAEARARPGVVAVETGATIGLGVFALVAATRDRCHPPLVTDRVRQVGEPLALVLAESEAEAFDAVELVDLDLSPLAAVVRPGEAGRVGPALYPDDQVSPWYGEIVDGGPDPTSGADVVVELSVANQRVASCPLECDGILVVPDAPTARTDDRGTDDRGTGDPGGLIDVWCTSQGVQSVRSQLAEALELAPERFRVRSPAVGGGFGGRATIPPEFVAVVAAAVRHRRPVRWIQSRYENLIGMAQGRGYASTVRVGLDRAQGLVGLDIDITADGGSTGHMSAFLLPSARRQVPGLYCWPAYRFRARAANTTTAPVGAYRGAGQPEANHARERTLDLAARRLGVDPIDFRRRHLVAAEELPFDTLGGFTYDAADPHRALDRALELADIDRWRAEQARRRGADDPNEIGIGMANYAQTSGRGGPVDSALVRVGTDGAVTVACASPGHGQGHRTTWAALVTDRLGVEAASVTVIDADTALIDQGQSTGGSRSTQVAATAIVHACDDVIDAAREIAATWLEAAPDDLVVTQASHGLGPGLAVAGVPTRRVTWAELAADAAGQCLEAARSEAVPDASYPYGTHVSVVEVDVETGAVRLLAHVAVDDCGVPLQPDLVAGQQHGGSVAGIAQALFEAVDHDADGNPLSATFATYLLPAASEMCSITTDLVEVPAGGNPLGTRGIGENGCNGATAAVHNGVIDALWPRGVEHVDLPLSPERVWDAIQRAGRAEG